MLFFSRVFIIAFLSLATLAGCTSSKKSESGSTYKGFGLDSISKQTLEKYAPPAPQAEIKNQVEKLVDIRVPSAGQVTNDGKKMFVNWNVTGTNQIWRLDGVKAFPVQMTGGEDRGNFVTLSPNNQWLVVSRDSKGDENPGLYLMRATGGELVKVFYDPKFQASFNGFTADSRYLYYRSNNIAPDSYAIYRYDVVGGKTELIWDKPGIWYLSDLEGDRAVLTKSNGSMQNEHFAFNLKTKEATPLIGQNEKEDYDIAILKNKDEYLIGTNKLADLRTLYKLKNGKLTEFISAKGDINGFSVSENRNHLAYAVNDNGYSQIKLMDLRTGKHITIPNTQKVEQAGWGSFSYNGRYITYSTELHNAPRKNYVLDIQTGKSTEWMSSSTPELDVSGYLRAELVKYSGEGGVEIPMFVWRSEECKKKTCPVVISFHGGPEGQSVPRFNPTINLYVQHGFVYAQPNVRGSDGYGKKWLSADNGAERLKVITDIRDASRFAKKQFAVHGVPPKVGITGGSYGGYSTLVGASMFADEFDAALAIVGMSSLVTFIENTAPYRRALRANEYGEPKTDRDFMLKLSPVSYIDKVKKPLLIAHGATDPRVPVGEAVQFHENVKRNNPDAQLIIFPDEGHGVSKRPNVVLLNSYAIAFFEKYLK